MAQIAVVPEPRIELPIDRPAVPLSRFQERLTEARTSLKHNDLDAFVIYGDREHAGDLHHLTGTDPRFEEGIFVLPRDGRPTLLLGNENQAYAPDPELGITVELYQELSPQGQFRHRPAQLADLLSVAGLERGARVGVAGGKYLAAGFVREPSQSFSVPSYLIDALRELVGAETLVNAQHLFVGVETGLRSINTEHEIAEAEYAAAYTSASVNAALKGIRVGARADRVSGLLFDGGVQHTVHSMVNFGAKTARGLSSPSDQTARLGDAFQIAQGLKGSLTCRAGAIAASRSDLPAEVGEFYESLTLNYFDTLVAWYGALSVGATGGGVFAAADAARDAELFDFSLNPGHTLGFEEWLESPFVASDTTPLNSGLLLQGDIIPVGHGPHVAVNIEDGIALADAGLRDRLASVYPRLWARVQARRDYLAGVIGVDLDDAVLPLSNTPLWHAPYVLDTTRALTV